MPTPSKPISACLPQIVQKAGAVRPINKQTNNNNNNIKYVKVKITNKSVPAVEWMPVYTKMFV